MSHDPFDQDPFDERIRHGLEFLRAQHLPGIEVDDEQTIVAGVEQARLAIVGGGGVLAAILTFVSGSHKALVQYPDYFIYAAILALLAVGLAVAANEMAIRLRWRRVDRRFEILRAFSAVWLKLRTGDGARISTAHVARERAFARERATTRCMQWLRYSSFACILGSVTILAAALAQVALYSNR